MKHIIKVLIVLMAVQSLAGCAYVKGKKAIVKNRDMAYLEGHEVKTLKIPQDLQNSTLGDELVIPPTNQSWNQQPPGLIPPDSLAAQIHNGELNPATLKLADKKSPEKIVKTTAGAVNTDVQLSSAGLLLPQKFAHSWNRLAKAIPAAGYKVLHENKGIKRYFIADLPATNNRMTKETAIYQLKFSQQGEYTRVTITANDEQPLKDTIAIRVLSDIQKALQAKPHKGLWSRWF